MRTKETTSSEVTLMVGVGDQSIRHTTREGDTIARIQRSVTQTGTFLDVLSYIGWPRYPKENSFVRAVIIVSIVEEKCPTDIPTHQEETKHSISVLGVVPRLLPGAMASLLMEKIAGLVLSYVTSTLTTPSLSS